MARKHKRDRGTGARPAARRAAAAHQTHGSRPGAGAPPQAPGLTAGGAATTQADGTSPATGFQPFDAEALRAIDMRSYEVRQRWYQYPPFARYATHRGINLGEMVEYLSGAMFIRTLLRMELREAFVAIDEGDVIIEPEDALGWRKG